MLNKNFVIKFNTKVYLSITTEYDYYFRGDYYYVALGGNLSKCGLCNTVIKWDPELYTLKI